MDQYVLSLLTKFEPDKQSLDSIKKTFDAFDKISLFSQTDEKVVNNLRAAFNTFDASKSVLKQLSSALTQYRQVRNMREDEDDDYTKQIKASMKSIIGNNKELKKQFGDAASTALDKLGQGFVSYGKTFLVDKFQQAGQWFISSLKQTFKDAWSELNSMMQSSFLTNSTTRQNAFTYGLNAAQSYGFEQAKSMLGIQSEEDMWYMNNQQREQFQRIMTKYAERYERLADSGFFEKMLDYQIEMQEFQQDVKLEIVEFFMNNKELIKTFMKVSMEFFKDILEAVDWLVDHFTDRRTTDEEKASNIDSILNSYTTNANKTLNYTQNNTIYGTDSQAKAGLDMLSSQVVEAKRVFGE